jgi:TonB family protein
MAPLPPISPPAPETPGARIRAQIQTTEADTDAARLDATEIILAKLRAMIASGTQEVDAILGTIAVAAHALTEASAAAIAMPRDGVVVCVGRSGETAPELGAPLNVDSGISGECLRTGMILRVDDAARDFKVDSEVCRQLGLQSIAVVPLRGRTGRVGVLEVFSTQSYAFTQEHTDLLGRLAGLAEAAWAQGAAAEPAIGQNGSSESRTAQTLASESVVSENLAPEAVGSESFVAESLEAEQPVAEAVELQSHLAAASVPLERVGAAVVADLEQQTRRKRYIAIGAGLSLVMLLLVSVIGWRLWYRASIQSGIRSRANQMSSATPEANTTPASAGADLAWKPGAERPVGHHSAVLPSHVTNSSRVVKIPDDVIRRLPPSTQASDGNPANHGSTPPSSQKAESTLSPTEVSLVASVTASDQVPGNLGSVLSTSSALPKLAAPVSQGVAGGTLVRKVQPVYPPEALRMRLEGSVILEANITESGQVEDLSVVSGHPMLAKAATAAVSQWRYSPYLLNGTPIRKQTRITINFIAP